MFNLTGERTRVESIASADAQIVLDEYRSAAWNNGQFLTFPEATALFEIVRKAFLRGAECGRLATLADLVSGALSDDA
jgi:hypothetical protein